MDQAPGLGKLCINVRVVLVKHYYNDGGEVSLTFVGVAQFKHFQKMMGMVKMDNQHVLRFSCIHYTFLV